jgi:hypothetical protein
MNRQRLHCPHCNGYIWVDIVVEDWARTEVECVYCKFIFYIHVTLRCLDVNGKPFEQRLERAS